MQIKHLFYILLVIFTLSACTTTKETKEILGKEGKSCYEDNTCDENLDCVNGICIINKCNNIVCDEIWSECNKETGNCDLLKDGFCVLDGHCNLNNNEICDQDTFKCVESCIENQTRCSEDGSKIEICNNNNWIENTICNENQVCKNTTTDKQICGDKCTSHDSCQNKEFCNDIGQCLKYTCNTDLECASVNSINNNEIFYCDVFASERTCVLFKDHTCGGESSNDMSSNAQEIDITTLMDNDISLDRIICIADQDWYKINLTKDTNSLDFTLSFQEGDLDLIIVDADFKTIGYSMASHDPTIGGEEKVSSKFLPKGVYYIHIYRYKTSLDTDITVESSYNLTISNIDTVTKCTTMGKECENLEVLRSVCNEEMGSCERTDANNSANLGELCEEKNNCTEDATYGCFDFEIPGINLDNYCTKICSSDSDCSGLINSKCQSFVITAFCIKPCTSDNDCKLILEDETATCNNEKCETN